MGARRWSVVVMVVLWACPAWAATKISPSFLGMYRKTMEIEKEIAIHTARYGVNPLTARAVVIQESGGDANLVSSAGAGGYFQVMPGTFRMLKVRSNIEAGIKYLAQLQRQFGREDYAIAAYNAGPGAVGSGRPLRLETLQYVIGVGYYKSVLRLHEAEIRRQAEALELQHVRQGDTWQTVARRTGVPAPLLQLYNPFLAPRPLKAGALVVYPSSVPHDLFEYEGESLYYTSRIGDSYLNLALVFGTDLEVFRRDNDLWRLQQLPAGVRLQVNVPPDSPFRQLRLAAKPASKRVAAVPQIEESPSVHVISAKKVRVHKVRRGETLPKIAARYQTNVIALIRTNHLTDSRLPVGSVLLIPTGENSVEQPVVEKEPRVHTIRPGETLEKIASRYQIPVQTLMQANNLPDGHIQVGASLQIPEG